MSLFTKLFASNKEAEKPDPSLSRKVEIHIRPTQSADPQKPSIAKLGNDILVSIFEILQDTHAKSLPTLRMVNSNYNFLAEYISYHTLELNLSIDGAPKSKARLEYLKRYQLLAAVRRLKVIDAVDECDCDACPELPLRSSLSDRQPAFIALLFLQELLPSMTGLRNIEWQGSTISHTTINLINSIPKVRLHATPCNRRGWHGGGKTFFLEHLHTCSALYSLNVSHTYSGAEDCLLVTKPLKEVLLQCQNLRCLTLDIGQPRSGCVVHSPPREYCGVGFEKGERPPALEKLEIGNYPFGHEDTSNDTVTSYLSCFSQGYPEKGSEEEYWTKNFDWSRLRSLKVPNSRLALQLMPKLTALEEVSLQHHWGDDHVSRFYLEVPSSLRAITTAKLGDVTLEGILRHGNSLRMLQLHQNEFYNRGGNTTWKDMAIDDVSLLKIRDECSMIEDLRLDVGREGDWPWHTLNIIAGFPRLRRLTLYFELGMNHDDKVTEPKVTYSTAQSLFKYLREHSTTKPPQLNELHIYSGSPPGIGHGYPSPMAFWPQHNSAHFLCRLADRDDEAARGVFSTECPDYNERVNKMIRGEKVKKVDMGATAACYTYAHDDEYARVARDGPVPRTEWRSHY